VGQARVGGEEEGEVGWKVGCVGAVGAVALRGKVEKVWKEKLRAASAAPVILC